MLLKNSYFLGICQKLLDSKIIKPAAKILSKLSPVRMAVLFKMTINVKKSPAGFGVSKSAVVI